MCGMDPKSRTIENADIDALRDAMRAAGCVYQGMAGWFYFARPVGIFHDGSRWFTVLPF